VDYEDISWHAVTDPELALRLQDMAVRAFVSMGGRGYGRIDVRSDEAGQELKFLEVNPNCGLFYPQGLYGSADFILDRVDTQTGHAQFIEDQVQVARRLWQQRQEECPMEARYVNGSWGMYALRDITEGQIIQRNEEANLRVVTKAHVLQHWSRNDKDNQQQDTVSTVSTAEGLFNTWDNFRAYCWPLSDNLFAMWQADPDQWQPLNHSCDPNAWFATEGRLNVVARRPIAAGEEICMDYATFCGYFPEMQEFTCQCQSLDCRGIITGLDIVKYPELVHRYQGHLSDYVETKVAGRGYGDSCNGSATTDPASSGSDDDLLPLEEN
jgi:D-alanine-D-alanine ligase